MIGRDEPFAWLQVAQGRRNGICCAFSDPIDQYGHRFICTRDAGHRPPHKAHDTAARDRPPLAVWIGDRP